VKKNNFYKVLAYEGRYKKDNIQHPCHKEPQDHCQEALIRQRGPTIPCHIPLDQVKTSRMELDMDTV
jgi:hypothetical protein